MYLCIFSSSGMKRKIKNCGKCFEGIGGWVGYGIETPTGRKERNNYIKKQILQP
jgi:hypothetical protein